MMCFLLLSSCAQEEENVIKEYTIVVSSIGGMYLPDVRVDVYKDGAMEKLVWAGETDESGRLFPLYPLMST